MKDRRGMFPILRDMPQLIVGSFLIAAGSYNFAIAAELPLTGFTGIAYLLNLFTGFPIGWAIVLMNIPVAILCVRKLGRGFFLRSMVCMLMTSLMLDYVVPLLPVYAGDRLLAALATGVVAGAGYAMIYVRNSSTGGVDFLTMAAKAHWPYIALGRISFTLDAAVILVIGIVLRDMDAVIYGFVVSYLMSIVIDRTIFGLNAGKLALIVTDRGRETCDLIEATCHRGSTILRAQGGYRQEDRQVVMCACSTKQMVQLQTVLKEADPESFMIIIESNEVHGAGFRTVSFGETEKSTQDK